MPDIKRRTLLQAAAGVPSRMSLSIGDNSIAGLLRRSYNLHEMLVGEGCDLVQEYFKEVSDSHPGTPVDINPLSKYLIGRIGDLGSCLQALVRADQKYAQKKGEEKGPFQKILDLEKHELTLPPTDSPTTDAPIFVLQKEIGIDNETWQRWVEVMLGDDRHGLLHEKGFINHTTGGFSRFFMDHMPKDSTAPQHARQVAIEMAKKLDQAFPVDVPYAHCSVLRDTISEPPAASQKARGQHTQKLIEEREKGDLLPFELDHYGRPPGNDVY